VTLVHPGEASVPLVKDIPEDVAARGVIDHTT
jgi:hypothetical protein